VGDRGGRKEKWGIEVDTVNYCLAGKTLASAGRKGWLRLGARSAKKMREAARISSHGCLRGSSLCPQRDLSPSFGRRSIASCRLVHGTSKLQMADRYRRIRRSVADLDEFIRLDSQFPID